MISEKLTISSTKPFTVALTGGIAAGKTTASDHFNSLGVTVIDTDEIAKKITKRGQPILGEIAEAFGATVLLDDETLNRRMLRELIFNNLSAKQLLESILHPAIEEHVIQELSRVNGPYCILVIPLFAENRSYRWVDRVLLIDAPEYIQTRRVVLRDKVSIEQAKKILKNQASREKRISVSDDVISNDGDPGSLLSKVEQLHQKYLKLAESRAARQK